MSKVTGPGSGRIGIVLLAPLAGMVGQSPVQAFRSGQQQAEAAVLGWVPWFDGMLMPKAGLVHQGHGRGSRIRVSWSAVWCAEIPLPSPEPVLMSRQTQQAYRPLLEEARSVQDSAASIASSFLCVGLCKYSSTPGLSAYWGVGTKF